MDGSEDSGQGYRYKDKQAFYSTRSEEERSGDKRRVLTLSLNVEEYNLLVEDMRLLEQSKDSTALKQLWKVGRAVLHDPETGLIIRSIFHNLRKNKRMGIQNVEAELPTSYANVTQKNDEM